MVLIDGRYAATSRFRDAPRPDSRSFIGHLGPRHHFDRILLVSGDRESEVRYLAELVGIDEVHAGQTPEEKVAITRQESSRAPTVFIGDGINDAPALVTATVGVAFGTERHHRRGGRRGHHGQFTEACRRTVAPGRRMRRSRCKARSAGWR